MLNVRLAGDHLYILVYATCCELYIFWNSCKVYLEDGQLKVAFKSVSGIDFELHISCLSVILVLHFWRLEHYWLLSLVKLECMSNIWKPYCTH